MGSTRFRRSAAAALACAALGLGAFVLLRPDGSAPPAAARPAPTVSTAAPTSVPVAAAATPVVRRPAVPHDRVAPAAPSTFRISGPAFDIRASVCAMPNVRPLDPPGDQVRTVCWVREGFGVAPGAPSTGTSYILGHAWSQAKLVFNPLSEFATAHTQGRAVVESGVATYPVPALRGYTVRLTTPNGRLQYRVSRAYLVGKLDAGSVASLMAERTRNRIVLITCAVKDGVDLDQNLVVYASLVSSSAR